MIIRPCAEFGSLLPEDTIVDEAGEFVQWGGKSVMFAIAELLAQIGAEPSEPQHAHEHGWEMEFHWKKRRFWCQVTLIEDYVFVIKDPAFLSRRSSKNRLIYADAMTRLANALAEDSRFQNVRWYPEDEVLGGGPGLERPVSP